MDMGWLLHRVLAKKAWPKIKPKPRRAITSECFQLDIKDVTLHPPTREKPHPFSRIRSTFWNADDSGGIWMVPNARKGNRTAPRECRFSNRHFYSA